ncbi:hypothetical protein [Phocaeicola sp.]|uniref:hypothetical protein n=1 Tax=Phocaeicola sp. TaxID=2773926 RepID=UPI0023CBAD2B|nr:hypothetical protein [Phocaeicola sp.]MDE5678730.1 hypothetical protein [Phocaeicola sp.]
MNENDRIERYRALFDMTKDNLLFEDTLSLLQRATKAREVAEVVARLFDVGSINSDRVVTKEFIGILIGVASHLQKGGSVNNIREHINSIIARDRWKAREKEGRESKPFKINEDTISINFTVTLDREKFALLQDIIHQMDMVLSRVTVSHFDGRPDTVLPVYQLQGVSPSVAVALRKIYDKFGADSLTDIHYASESSGFDRGHLTLLQTIQLAENEY